tara:strand:+ start:809 stop:2185 length:1377 start_codon:yes stop_codon:yes gene_type:complete
MADSKLSRSISSAGTTTKGTYSCWVKRSRLTEGFLFLSQENGNNNFRIRFNSLNLQAEVLQGGSVTGTLSTTRLFRDTSNWYHIVVAIDSTLATANDRMKIYVNGTQESSFSARTNPSQNANMSINEAGTQYVGAQESSNYLDGYLSHVHYIDGTAYAASTFGETDSTSGIWKPKTAPSVTYGTNGFFLKFENSGAMGTDSSGNSNTFTTLGTLTQATDTPSNNFTALNPLLSGTGTGNAAAITTAGNTRADVGNNVWRTLTSSIAVSSGKWYFEGFGTSQASAYQHYGITSLAKFAADATMPDKEINEEQNGYAYGYYGNNGQIYYSTPSARSNGAYGSSYGASDYVGIFVDLDNNKLYVAKNGTLANSGTGYDISADGKPYFLAMSIYGANAQINFGQGVFGYSGTSYAKLTGTTYADANGHGVFKYSPNQGGASNFDSAAKNFYALNTENLKEFG